VFESRVVRRIFGLMRDEQEHGENCTMKSLKNGIPRKILLK
jgi:hypothetical protein